MLENDKLQGFLLGTVITSIVYYLVHISYDTNGSTNQDNNKKKNLIRKIADDDCHSLFYGIHPRPDGAGFSELKPIEPSTIQIMKTTHKEYTRLPFDFYKQAVENLPIVCVDVICKRSDGKILLFYRRDKPVAQLWWWPGGRLFRGETFYETAVRKIRDETGNKYATVNPIGVVDVWNTFFPDSNWDTERAPGKEGTQTVNITVVCELMEDIEGNFQLQDSGRLEWAVESSKWISPIEAMEIGKYDKYISLNVKLAFEKGYL